MTDATHKSNVMPQNNLTEKDEQWRRFRMAVQEARKGFEDIEPAEAQALIDQAITAVRRPQGDKP